MEKIFLCGGTGLYLESILLNYETVPDNNLRKLVYIKSTHSILKDNIKKYNSLYHTKKDNWIYQFKSKRKFRYDLNQLNTKKH